MQSLKAIHWVAILVAIAGTAYAFLFFSEAQAGYDKTLGTISLTQHILNPDNHYESITLGLAIIPAIEAVNLTGWTLTNSSDFKYDLSLVMLPNSGTVRICEENAPQGENCDYRWPGNDVFNDDGDVLTIYDVTGVPVITISYGDAAGGVNITSGDYTSYVFTQGDKISICEMQINGSLKASNANIQKITRDVEGTVAAKVDIVPPFLYERNKNLAYHPGINWPEGKDILASGCK